MKLKFVLFVFVLLLLSVVVYDIVNVGNVVLEWYIDINEKFQVDVDIMLIFMF